MGRQVGRDAKENEAQLRVPEAVDSSDGEQIFRPNSMGAGSIELQATRNAAWSDGQRVTRRDHPRRQPEYDAQFFEVSHRVTSTIGYPRDLQ